MDTNKNPVNRNINGKRAETIVQELFDAFGVEYVKQHKYTSIYDHTARMDFYIPLWDLAVEVKNQNGSGSVSEKLPYVMEAFEQHPAQNGLLLMWGTFWPTKPGMKAWVEKRADSSEKDITALYMDQFEDWLSEQTETRRAA